jgi:hypothetical protein
MARWRSTRENGDFRKWVEAGQVLEGVFLGTIDANTGKSENPHRGERCCFRSGPSSSRTEESQRKSERTYKAFNVSILERDEDPEQGPSRRFRCEQMTGIRSTTRDPSEPTRAPSRRLK